MGVCGLLVLITMIGIDCVWNEILIGLLGRVGERFMLLFIDWTEYFLFQIFFRGYHQWFLLVGLNILLKLYLLWFVGLKE